MEWDAAFLDYVRKLNKRKPVIFCGDLNCAHTEIDLANPKNNRKNAGFTEDERAGLDRMVEANFFDQSQGESNINLPEEVKKWSRLAKIPVA